MAEPLVENLDNSQSAAANLFVRDWHVLDYQPAVNISDQLSKDIHTLKLVNAGSQPDTLSFWSSKPAVVVGTAEARLPNYEDACQHLEKMGYTVLPRLTGGTAFPQTAGVINVSAVCAITAQQRSVKQSYQDFCSVLKSALASLGIHASMGLQPSAFCDGDYNLLVGSKKLIGTAQRWQRNAVLAHAAILFEIDKSELTEVINSFYAMVDTNKRFQAKVLSDVRSCRESLHAEDLCAALSDEFCA